ncbi:hypothetical protein APR12_003669 [Nocardia amikacinitolerans]|uniref:hypothetical protein n=1 Tax=Nocardia amikacinitolerans TaxID=756689 RepID=UPI0008359A37|nr:hypothetical protein [Nocardia amikacinitolerans]MCP2318316.1 hypothetical protein [Nocardia amikacinitolerans]
MSDDLQAQMRQWQQLKEQAVTGEFRMDEGIGEALRKRCETMLRDLDTMVRDAQQLQYLAGYGSLPSAVALQEKFQNKAVNGGPHDSKDSAATRLQQHIEVVQLMHDTYAAAIGKLQETDQTAGTQLTAHTEGMN